jgi:outer membrane protein
LKNKVIYIILLFPLWVTGQDSLSLKKAIEIGLQKNYDIQLTAKNVEINKLLNSWGEAGRLPQVNVSTGQNNNLSDQRKNPISQLQGTNFLFSSNEINLTPNLNWTIFNGFGIRANKNKLDQLQNQSENTATLAIENTIHGIILAYYQAKMQYEQFSLLKNILQLTKEKYQQQELKNEIGIGVKFDLLQYESNLYTDSANSILQDLAYKNSIRNLNLIIGEEIEKKWYLTSKIKPQIEERNFTILKNEMLSNNTNIKNQYINIALTDQDIALAKSSFYPVISFNAGTNYSTGILKSDDVPQFQSLQTKNLNYYGNFTLNFRLYDGGKVRRGIKALEIQKEVNQLQTDQLTQQLVFELTNVYELYQTRLQLFELNKKAFFVARDNLDIARLKEKSGLISSFNFRDIEMAYLTAGISLFQSSYDLLESNATLLKMTGKIIQTNAE